MPAWQVTRIELQRQLDKKQAANSSSPSSLEGKVSSEVMLGKTVGLTKRRLQLTQLLATILTLSPGTQRQHLRSNSRAIVLTQRASTLRSWPLGKCMSIP